MIYNHQKENNSYVEAYDIATDGKPINAHPLSIQESIALAKALDTSDELKRQFLKPAGLLPKNVLYINPDRNGYAIWHTPPQQRMLYFSTNLGLPNGKAAIPALVWRANRTSLSVYALADNNSIDQHTPIYRAPFFNVHQDGKVCMGNVNINLPNNCGLEEFIRLWEDYFFNSFFSHGLGTNPVKGNIIQLWQKLIGKRKAFPTDQLTTHPFTLKKLIQ